MKSLILFTVLLLATVQFTIAQNAIAKLKYEEAEEAFASNDFELTISKLIETEILLKATNPKILYLQITAQIKIIEKNPYDDYDLIENTRKLSTKYLTDYEKIPDNIDKFRDIYKISEELKQYPNTIQKFNLQKQQNKADEEIRKSNEILIKQKAEESFKNFSFYKDFKIGLTLDETYKLYPEFKKSYKSKGSGNELTICTKNKPTQYQPRCLSIKNNIVYGYDITFYMNKVDDAQYSIGTKTLTEILNRLNNEFLFSPKETTTESTSKVSGMDLYTKTKDYTWSKNTKTIILSFSQSTYMGEYLTNGDFHSEDESLIK